MKIEREKERKEWKRDAAWGVDICRKKRAIGHQTKILSENDIFWNKKIFFSRQLFCFFLFSLFCAFFS